MQIDGLSRLARTKMDSWVSLQASEWPQGETGRPQDSGVGELGATPRDE